MGKQHRWPDDWFGGPSPAVLAKTSRNECIEAFIERMGWDWRRWTTVRKFYRQHAAGRSGSDFRVFDEDTRQMVSPSADLLEHMRLIDQFDRELADLRGRRPR